MSLPASDGDKARATAFETTQKKALTEGVASYADAVMTPAQYTDSPVPANVNKLLAAASFFGMRALPWQLLVCEVSTAPDANTNEGALIYVRNGAEGNACLAFSDGAHWRRCDTLDPISSAP